MLHPISAVVALSQVQLLLRWVTVCWQINHFCIWPTPRSTQPSIRPW